MYGVFGGYGNIMQNNTGEDNNNNNRDNKYFYRDNPPIGCLVFLMV